MAVRDIFKFSRKTFFNPAGWMDVEYIATQTSVFKTVLKNLMSKPTVAAKEETFPEAMKRLNLTEESVTLGASNYRLFALFFLLLGMLFFFYAFFTLFRYRHLIAFLLSLCMSGLFLAYAFKYDFWSLQMRKRRLGITYKEWMENLVGSRGKSQ